MKQLAGLLSTKKNKATEIVNISSEVLRTLLFTHPVSLRLTSSNREIKTTVPLNNTVDLVRPLLLIIVSPFLKCRLVLIYARNCSCRFSARNPRRERARHVSLKRASIWSSCVMRGEHLGLWMRLVNALDYLKCTITLRNTNSVPGLSVHRT